ncbi:hypothetical protein GCM10009533_68770 [Saccharopolyspora spinosporotrichia]|uniref:Uncharacterized protein n=1 Tax=Saccharopolyspora erythraea TaxID=1836 RepID=A0ABP3P9J0_SACER
MRDVPVPLIDMGEFGEQQHDPGRAFPQGMPVPRRLAGCRAACGRGDVLHVVGVGERLGHVGDHGTRPLLRLLPDAGRHRAFLRRSTSACTMPRAIA